MFEKEENYSEESKYVADILSGMASVAASVSSTTYSIPSTAAFASGITSTPTLTPNTLANIERTFIELQAVPAGVNASTGQDPHTQSGFVPPIVDPVTSDRSTDAFEYADGDPDWVPGSKRARMEKSNGVSVGTYQVTDATPVRKRRNLKDDKLSPEEDQRRRVRRERNKVAAAKCRQRRVDHTNRLTDETEVLESEKDSLEAEIQSLQQQKDQLEFVLQAHRPLCKRDHGAHVMVSSVNNSVAPISLEKVKVKTEPLSTMCNMGGATKTIASGLRPMTLSIKKEKTDMSGATTATGVPITTPSGGFYFSMDMDHTGLTPITNGPTSCSGEANRTSSESSAEAVTSPTLISL